MRYSWLHAAALLAGACAGAPAMAEEHPQTRWQANLLLENDLFNNGEDDDYTNGVMLSVTSPEHAIDGVFARFARDWGLIENNDLRTEFAFSQAMFTPSDLTLAAPDPNDRPYAGLTLVSLGLIAAANGAHETRGRRFDQVVLSLGMVGPASGADGAQVWVHEHLDETLPQGWSSQIPNRLVGGLSYNTTRRAAGIGPDDDVALYWHAGASLGSIQTDASLGATLRIGYHAPATFGLPRIAPSLPGSGYFVREHDLGWYAFLGVQARYVGYDVTLDERPSRGESNIVRKDVVGDVQLGLVAYWRDLRLSYTHVWRTEQFTTQRRGDGFGSLAIGFALPF